MSDKAHTVALMAAQLLTKYGDLEIQGNALYIESSVKAALALYDEAVKQVMASGPTSTDLPPCSCYLDSLVPTTGYLDCPRHG